MPSRDHMLGFMPALYALAGHAPAPTVARPTYTPAAPVGGKTQAQRAALDKAATAALRTPAQVKEFLDNAAAEIDDLKKVHKQVNEEIKKAFVFKGARSDWFFGPPPRPGFYFAHKYSKERVKELLERYDGDWSIPEESSYIRYWDGNWWSDPLIVVDQLATGKKRTYLQAKEEIRVRTLNPDLNSGRMFQLDKPVYDSTRITWSQDTVLVGHMANSK